MTMKKYILVFAVCALLAGFAGLGKNAFAASGEGYFGGGDAPDLIQDAAPSAGVAGVYEDDNDDYSDYENELQDVSIPDRTKKAVNDKREKYSEDTAKVINSYGLTSSKAKGLINRHNDAAKGMGKEEKFDRYKRIYNANKYDYLAAYRLAQVSFEMGHNAQAMSWLNTCLDIFPNYMPARQLKKKVEGAMKW